MTHIDPAKPRLGLAAALKEIAKAKGIDHQAALAEILHEYRSIAADEYLGIKGVSFDRAVDASGTAFHAALVDDLVTHAQHRKLDARTLMVKAGEDPDRLNNGGLAEAIDLLLRDDDADWIRELIDS